MTAPIMRHNAKSMIQKEEHVCIPIVGGERPAVAEHNRLPHAPVLVKNLYAVFGGN